MLADIEQIGRNPRTGGYRRDAWSSADMELREWFTHQAAKRGLTSHEDRNGNLWAWWGDPSVQGPGLVTGSHLDSVREGGAFDGPLGVASAFEAIDLLRGDGFQPERPIAVACFTDEEGARFGVPCIGSRLLTGVLDPDRARSLRDDQGQSLADVLRARGREPGHLGRDDETLARVGVFVELHVEQGRALEAPVGVASAIWPHGRWRFDFRGTADHAGTTAFEDRDDPMLAYAHAVLAARTQAEAHGVRATFGKVRVEPNNANAIPSLVTAWLDARGPETGAVRSLVAQLAADAEVTEESWTPEVTFDEVLRLRVACLAGLDGHPAPILPTAAGHDAGILASAGVPTAMLFVRNPTGVSHAPGEFAEPRDCVSGVIALAAVLADLSGGGS